MTTLSQYSKKMVAQRSHRDVVLKSSYPIRLAFFVFLFLVLVSSWFSNGASHDVLAFFNLIIPTAILLVSIITAARMVTRFPESILTPVPWFYISAAAYFGFGALAWTFADPVTLAYINQASHAPTDDFGVYRANLMSLSSMCLMSFFFIVFGALLKLRRLEEKAMHTPPLQRSGEIVFWVFVAIGGLTKYALVLPETLGVEITIPSMLAQLSLFLQASIIIGFVLVSNGNAKLKLPLVILVVSEIATAMTTASKTAVIYVFVALLIGVVIQRRNLRLPVILGMVIIPIYVFFLSPFMALARSYFDLKGRLTFGVLQNVIADFWNGQRADMGVTDAQLWWARFNFSNYQEFAISEYARGNAGDSLQQIYWVFVPRILYPDKPTVGYGAELSDILYSGSGAWTQTSMTWIAEAYWNLGAAGLVIICASAAFMMSLFSFIILKSAGSGRVGHAVLAILGVQLALSIESYFVQTWVGGAALALVYALLCWVIESAVISVTGQKQNL